MKKINFVVFLLVLSLGASAQSYQKTNLGIKAQINATDVEIQFFGSSTVRVLKSPVGKIFTKESLSVVKKPETTKLAIHQQGDVISLKSNQLKVDVDLKSGKISYSTLAGVLLLSEKVSGTTFTDFNDAGSKTYTVNQLFMLDKNEDIYGLGQQQRGKLSLRNAKINMVQGNTDDYVPFLVSTKGYGLFWDNYSPTVFEDKAEYASMLPSNRMWAIVSIIILCLVEISMALSLACATLPDKLPCFPCGLLAFGKARNVTRVKVSL